VTDAVAPVVPVLLSEEGQDVAGVRGVAEEYSRCNVETGRKFRKVCRKSMKVEIQNIKIDWEVRKVETYHPSASTSSGKCFGFLIRFLKLQPSRKIVRQTNKRTKRTSVTGHIYLH
jgi:hypothetical protein